MSDLIDIADKVSLNNNASIPDINKITTGDFNTIKNAVNTMSKYSTAEQRVGTWKDGRAIFKKTVEIQNTSFSNGDNYVAHNISNLEQCIKAELTKRGTHIFPYINYNPNNNILSSTFVSNVDSSNITIRVLNDSWGSYNVWYVTLFYIKNN